MCKPRQNFIIGFISHDVQHSFLTFGVARNDFFKKIFKIVVQKFAI